MASNRAFKNLASLRDSFNEPYIVPDEEGTKEIQLPEFSWQNTSVPPPVALPSAGDLVATLQQTGISKQDGRNLRKVLKTPSVSLSVSVRKEIHEEVSAMLFAGKSTWIALVDQLLTDYVKSKKSPSKLQKL